MTFAPTASGSAKKPGIVPIAPRRSGSQQVIPGGVIEKEAPLHISNVQLVCPACGKPSRIGYRENSDGSKVRICRSCEKDID